MAKFWLIAIPYTIYILICSTSQSMSTFFLNIKETSYMSGYRKLYALKLLHVRICIKPAIWLYLHANHMHVNNIIASLLLIDQISFWE